MSRSEITHQSTIVTVRLEGFGKEISEQAEVIQRQVEEFEQVLCERLELIADTVLTAGDGPFHLDILKCVNSDLSVAIARLKMME